MWSFSLTSDFDRKAALLLERAPARLARALNRSIGSAKTVAVREIAADTKLKQAVIREQLKIENATPERLVATLSVSGKRIPVYDFNARGPFPSRGRGKGVRANTPARTYPRAFIAQMSTGHKGVFERIPGKYMRARGPRGGRREAIRELFGPSLPHVFAKLSDQALARGQEQLTKNVASEWNFLVRQAAAA